MQIVVFIEKNRGMTVIKILVSKTNDGWKNIFHEGIRVILEAFLKGCLTYLPLHHKERVLHDLYWV